MDVFAQNGWNVVAGARRMDRLETLAKKVEAANPGSKVLPVICDVNSDESVKAAFAATEKEFGVLRALINNAGFGLYGKAAEAGLENFRAQMETNFFGVIRCTQAAVPLLKKGAQPISGKYGSGIVMISSIVGRRAFPGSASYCASKFALEGYSESLRLELKRERISVSVVNPGLTRTEFFEATKDTRPANYLDPAHGMPAEKVARVVFGCIKRPRRNVYLTAAGKAGVFMEWFAPRLLDWGLERSWKG